MAFRDSDKSTPKPFSDKKPDNFVQETPFFDSDLEGQVWDDISKLGGKQIACEEIDLIYRAFAEKISSISGEISNLKSDSGSDSQKTSDKLDELVKKSEDLAKSEKEESEKIESSISSIIDLTDITKVDEKSDEHPTELDEKLLTNIYKKIVKTISSPSILIPFITKISEKIYDSITQSSSKIFNELNKEFKDQMKIDILGDIKDIAKAKEIKTIGSDKLDEEAVKRLAEREKKRKEQEKKEQEKKKKDSSKDGKKKDEIKTKNSETSETTELERLREERRKTTEIEEIEEVERKLKEESDDSLDSETISDSPKPTEEPEREAGKKKNGPDNKGTNEDQLEKRSFTSIRDALVATQESLNDSNQKIKKIWDETLKMNDLEEYSITKDKDESDDGKKKEDKKKDDKKNDSDKGGGINFGKFALIGALAACYFLFKGYANQAHIKKYLETHPPIESIQRDISQTVESGSEELRTGLQKEIDKSLKDGDVQPVADNQSDSKQTDENIPEDPELTKKIEEYGETVSEATVEAHETARIDSEAEEAKKVQKQLQDASRENQEQFEEFQNQHRLKNENLNREINQRRKEAEKAGEELQTQLSSLANDAKKTEESVKDFVDNEEQRNKHDKKITDSASGLLTTETEVIVNQQNEIKAHEEYEQGLVEEQKRKDEQTKKKVTESFEEVQDGILSNEKALEEKLKKDPEVTKKLAAIKSQSFKELERSGLEITDYMDSVFSKISSNVLKYNNKEDENVVIEAATTNNKYVIIDMESYKKMLNVILTIGTDALSCDNQVVAKLGQRPLR